jgi:hypothetical protein
VLLEFLVKKHIDTQKAQENTRYLSANRPNENSVVGQICVEVTAFIFDCALRALFYFLKFLAFLKVDKGVVVLILAAICVT